MTIHVWHCRKTLLIFFFRKSWNWKDSKFFQVQFGPVVNFSTTKKASSTLLLFFGLEVWGSENSEDAKEICLEISCCGQAPSFSEQRKLVNIHAFLLSFSYQANSHGFQNSTFRILWLDTYSNNPHNNKIFSIFTTIFLPTVPLKQIYVLHIECSKQFKSNLYFYVFGQSRPFWAVLSLL